MLATSGRQHPLASFLSSIPCLVASVLFRLIITTPVSHSCSMLLGCRSAHQSALNVATTAGWHAALCCRRSRRPRSWLRQMGQQTRARQRSSSDRRRRRGAAATARGMTSSRSSRRWSRQHWTRRLGSFQPPLWHCEGKVPCLVSTAAVHPPSSAGVVH